MNGHGLLRLLVGAGYITLPVFLVLLCSPVRNHQAGGKVRDVKQTRQLQSGKGEADETFGTGDRCEESVRKHAEIVSAVFWDKVSGLWKL